MRRQESHPRFVTQGMAVLLTESAVPALLRSYLLGALTWALYAPCMLPSGSSVGAWLEFLTRDGKPSLAGHFEDRGPLLLRLSNPYTGRGLVLLHCCGVAPPDELLLGPAGTRQDKGSRLKWDATLMTVGRRPP
jgi:hypothetical protein